MENIEKRITIKPITLRPPILTPMFPTATRTAQSMIGGGEDTCGLRLAIPPLQRDKEGVIIKAKRKAPGIERMAKEREKVLEDIGGKETPPTYVKEAAWRRARVGVMYFAGGQSREQVERMKKVGDRLRQARKEQGLSRAQLAPKVGLDIGSLYYLEHGLMFPEEIEGKEEALGELARTLGQDPATLRHGLLGR